MPQYDLSRQYPPPSTASEHLVSDHSRPGDIPPWSATSSSVSVAGYTHGGGPGGSSRLTTSCASSISSTARVAFDSPFQMQSDSGDRDAWWAFRCGDGAGIATPSGRIVRQIPDRRLPDQMSRKQQVSRWI
jgi:hypothetical protein